MLLISRFICGTILHLSLLGEVTRGMQNMKFVLNHPYLFQSWFSAWLVGFCQAMSVLCVELCNIEIILISADPVNLVYNFVVLGIIAEFDDLVYGSLRRESMKQLVDAAVTEKILIIRHTTSKKCKEHELSVVQTPDGELRLLKVQFSSLSRLNKCA